MLDCLFVGIGGFVGTVLRYLVGLVPVKPASGFPVATLFINVVGAFAIGLIASAAARVARELDEIAVHRRLRYGVQIRDRVVRIPARHDLPDPAHRPRIRDTG